MSGWDMDALKLAVIRGERPDEDGLRPPLDEDGLSGLLDRSLVFLNEYVVLGKHEAVAVVLWVAHTHAIEAADVTPYLSIQSAEKRAGKTTLLDYLDNLVARAWRAVTPSEAVTFRKITADRRCSRSWRRPGQ